MITDEERREVAARLRANHRRDRESQGTFIARMVKGSDTVTASYVYRLPERLADLIDRPPRATASSRPSTAGRHRVARSAATQSVTCGGTIVLSAGRRLSMISDEERREAVEFLRSGKCLYFAEHRNWSSIATGA